ILDDGSIWFASEIKSLIEGGALRPELNYEALSDYAANRGTSDDQTLFSGIKRLPPGHVLIWGDGRTEISAYWELSYATDQRQGAVQDAAADEPLGESEYVSRFRDLFFESIRLRLMSDVPLGVFLSGGIDSSAIVAAMSESGAGSIKTFSVAFDEREANELEYARMVAREFSTD